MLILNLTYGLKKTYSESCNNLKCINFQFRIFPFDYRSQVKQVRSNPPRNNIFQGLQKVIAFTLLELPSGLSLLLAASAWQKQGIWVLSTSPQVLAKEQAVVNCCQTLFYHYHDPARLDTKNPGASVLALEDKDNFIGRHSNPLHCAGQGSKPMCLQLVWI